MQLNIKELDSHTGKLHIGIEFFAEGLHLQFSVDDYHSVLSDSLVKDLTWHYSEYALDIFTQPDRSIAARLMSAGKTMGDQLAGEDHELLQVQAFLAKHGYESLDVIIEGKSDLFFKEPWELLQLHESDLLLSSVARSFVRNIATNAHPENSFNPADSLVVKAEPRIMLMASRGEGNTLDSCILAHICSAMEAGYNLPVSRATDIAQLTEELKQSPSLLAFHYEGPLLETTNGVCIQMPGSELVTFAEFAKTLASAGIHLLVLSPIGSFFNIAPAIALAQKVGLHNIIVTQFAVPPVITRPALATLYQALLAGGELGNILAAVRQALLGSRDSSFFGLGKRSIELWPALVLYSSSRLYFEEQARDPLSSTQNKYQVLHRLHGFRSRMLPPLQVPAVDPPGFLKNIQRVVDNHATLSGTAGIGKTQYLHWLATFCLASDNLTQAFYFDLVQEYEADSIPQMLVNALGLDNIAELDTLLDKQKCLFVFDHDEAQHQPDWVNKLLVNWRERGHTTIVASRQARPTDTEDLLPITLGAMSKAQEAALLAAKGAGSFNTQEKPEERIKLLLDASAANPWIIQHILPHLLTEQGSASLAIAQRLKNSDALVATYFDWRWNNLSCFAQRLLKLGSGIKGLLLDMLQILDQEPSLAKLRDDFFCNPAANPIQIKEVLQELDRSGLLIQYPHGRLIDEDFSELIEDAAGHADLCEKITFARALSSSIQILANHLHQQPNPSILNNLLLNRRNWAMQLEILWRAGEYSRVSHVWQALNRLLRQFKLEHESRQWLTELMVKTPAPRVAEAIEQVESQRTGDIASWFRIAADCISTSRELALALEESALSWASWLEDNNVNTLKRLQVLAIGASGLLGQRAVTLKKWQDALVVTERIIPLLLEQQIWGILIENYQLAIEACHQLGLSEKALRYEQDLLHNIDYAEAPPGTVMQQYMFTIVQNLNAGNPIRAGQLLEKANAQPESKQARDMLADLQCQLDIAVERYDAALDYLLPLWEKVNQTGVELAIGSVRQRLMAIRKQIGAKAFDNICKNKISEDLALLVVPQ